MESNLKKRYIFAVTRHLPLRIQADVEKELDSLISEMMEARGGNDSEQTLKDVITELGPPEELALKYYGSERKALISGVYFLMYKRVLRIVLPIVAAVLAVLTIIGVFIMGNESVTSLVIGLDNANLDMTVFGRIVEVIATTIGGVIQAFAIITIVFAILDRMNVNMTDSDIHSNLPEISESKYSISASDAVFGIVFAIVTTVFLLGFPQIMSGRFDGTWVPVFDAQAIRALWFPILAWAMVEIIIEVAKLAEGRYTMRLAGFVLVTTILQAFFIVIVFGSNRIVNPDFMYHMGNMVEYLGGVADDPGFTGFFGFINIGPQPNVIIMIVMFIILLIEFLEVVIKAFQAQRH